MARTIDALLAPGAESRIRELLEPIIPDSSMGPTLDIGCGARARLRNRELIGIDNDFDAIRRLDGACFGVCGDAAALPFAEGVFCTVVSIGLLHHLCEDVAERSVREMLRVAASGGTIVVFDGILPVKPLRRPLAVLIRALDRGRHMRSARAISGLLDRLAVWEKSIQSYSKTGLEALVAIHRKQ